MNAVHTTIVNVSVKIPENSVDGFKSELEKWLRREIPDTIQRVVEDRFEDDLIEAYNDDFEPPEIDALSDIGEIKVSVVRVIASNNPDHCVYCGGICKREIFAGPPSGIRGDYGQMDCENCGYNIVFKTQGLESLVKSKEVAQQ